MTKFELLKQIKKEEEFVSLFLGIVKHCKTEKKIIDLLKTKVSEEQLKKVTLIADKGYPISLDGKQ